MVPGQSIPSSLRYFPDANRSGASGVNPESLRRSGNAPPPAWHRTSAAIALQETGDQAWCSQQLLRGSDRFCRHERLILEDDFRKFCTCSHDSSTRSIQPSTSLILREMKSQWKHIVVAVWMTGILLSCIQGPLIIILVRCRSPMCLASNPSETSSHYSTSPVHGGSLIPLFRHSSPEVKMAVDSRLIGAGKA
jgi:hypothetical protein